MLENKFFLALKLSVVVFIRFINVYGGPQVFWVSGENGYLFSGSWGALVIIFRDLGSKLIVLGIMGTQQKSKKNNLTLKEKPSFRSNF